MLDALRKLWEVLREPPQGAAKDILLWFFYSLPAILYFSVGVASLYMEEAGLVENGPRDLFWWGIFVLMVSGWVCHSITEQIRRSS